jgi:hypothetical protein
MHDPRIQWRVAAIACVFFVGALILPAEGFQATPQTQGDGEKTSAEKTTASGKSPAGKDAADSTQSGGEIAKPDSKESVSKGTDPKPTDSKTSPESPNRRRDTPANSPPKSDRQLAEDRKAREAARKRGEITFDDLKFEIEKGGDFKDEMITDSIRELNQKTLKLRGFILPTSVFQQTGIKQFVLVRDNQECCFGPGAALYDCVMIEMAPGKTASFSTRVVTVKGKLEIDTESFRYPDGGLYAVYKMSAEEVK